MVPIVPLLLLASMARAPRPANAALDAPTRHVRSESRYVRDLLRTGLRRSATFAALVSQLDRSDVIVYIEVLPEMPAALDGRLLMVPATRDSRYVRVQLAGRGSPEETIALLGHELRHAMEVADAPGVTDDEGMDRLYARIGMRHGRHQYETLAALLAGRQVRRELFS